MSQKSDISATQIKWDAIYKNPKNNTLSRPSEVLLNNLHFLPTPPKNALEIACGLGANTLFLESKGFSIDAWDISPIAIKNLKQQPTFSNKISALACDVLQQDIPRNSYDVIIIAHFLERDIIPKIISGLRPSGILFYQTFLQNKVSSAGPSNPKFLLAKDELPLLFTALNTLYYKEDAQIGEPKTGFRNEAMLVAQKP